MTQLYEMMCFTFVWVKCGDKLIAWKLLTLSVYIISSARAFNFQWLEPEFDISMPFFDNMTTCEVPGNNTHSEKICNFRNGFFKENIFNWWAGYGCFLYTQPALLNSSAAALRYANCLYQGFIVRCIVLPSTKGSLGCYPFDSRFSQVEETLSVQFSSSFGLERWRSCIASAEECCNKYGVDNIVKNDGDSCPPTWDGWECWPTTKADSVHEMVCSELAYSNSGPTCHHYSSKTCYSNGTWNVVTDYSTCSIAPRLKTRNYFHIGFLSISIVLCLPAIFVFFYYKKLRITRVALHRNLLIAILCRNILTIISRSQIILDELTSSNGDTLMARNEWPCKLLTILEKFSSSVTFFCMLVDGIYLHRLIAAVFKKKLNLKILYSIGGLLSAMLVVIWSTMMAVMNDSNCWLVYELTGVQWLFDGPRIAILLINTILLADILRIIMTKLKRQDKSNELSTVKATLFLMPLFGVQFLLTAYRPQTTSCMWEQIYYVFTYAMEGLQGVIVAILYCYCNKEVQQLIKTTYRKSEIVLRNIRNSTNKIRTRLSLSIAARRSTFTTTLDNNVNSVNTIMNTNNTATCTYDEQIATRSMENEIEQNKKDRTENLDDQAFEGFLNLAFARDSSDYNEEKEANEVKEYVKQIGDKSDSAPSKV